MPLFITMNNIRRVFFFSPPLVGCGLSRRPVGRSVTGRAGVGLFVALAGSLT